MSPRWSKKVPREPGLYWSARLIDGVQYATLRQISRDKPSPGFRSSLYLSPGFAFGREPLEIAIHESRHDKEYPVYWLLAKVPLMPGAEEVEA